MLQTETFLTLPGLKLQFETDRPELVPIVREIFSAGRPLIGNGSGNLYEIVLSAVSRPEMPSGGYSDLTVDDKFMYTAYSQASLINYLETVVTDALARHLTDFVLFHSGALASNGAGILLPGASGNGKSTTTTCLAMSGLTYYSDEMAVCSPDGLLLYPFPKVPSLKFGGRKVIEENFGKRAEAVFDPESNGVTYFKTLKLPSENEITNGIPIKFVLLPRRPEKGETLLEPIPKSEALRVLVEESLDLKIKHTAGFEAILRMLDSVECYTVRFGDVHKGVEMVRELVG